MFEEFFAAVDRTVDVCVTIVHAFVRVEVVDGGKLFVAAFKRALKRTWILLSNL